jgi:hypothetical protein
MKDPILSEPFSLTKAGQVDSLAFVGAFFGGLVIYVILHARDVPQFVITFSMVGVMLMYAWVVWKVPRLRVRLDQAGDNAYYLGLL